MGLFTLLASMSLVSLAGLATGVASFYLLGLVVYRLYLHPLAKYPGPLLGKLTDLHDTWHAYRGTRHLLFHKMHEQYGPVVRFGPNSLTFNSAEALKDIYGFKANVRKGRFYEAFPPTKDTFNTHSSIDKAAHARKRRVLSQAFSEAAMKGMEKHILAHVRQFCQNMGLAEQPTAQKTVGEWSSPKNASDAANYLTFDIMGDLCFGKSFAMQESEQNRFAIDLIANAAHRHLICGTFLPLHEYHLDKYLFRKISAGRARYMQYSKAQAGERSKQGLDVDRKDFFYYLLNAKDPETGAGFSPAELWGESNLLIIAGSDTTSTALAATIFYLVHNSEALQKACKEIRSTFEEEEQISHGPRLSSLHYLRACIDESMRLSPSVGGLLPREVLPGGTRVAGIDIPAGTTIGVPHYAIHHNEDYYTNAWSFSPERWLSDDKTEQARVQSAFCPFSLGPRGCIGKAMAYHELTLTLSRLLWRYDIRLAPGRTLGEGGAGAESSGVVDLEQFGRTRREEFQLKDTFTSMKDGPIVQVRERSS